jgi:hypothetical protein
MGAPPNKPARRHAPSNFRKRDIVAAITAAKASGLDITRVEVDPKTAKITLVVRNDDASETKLNPFDTAPVQDPVARTRKTRVL